MAGFTRRGLLGAGAASAAAMALSALPAGARDAGDHCDPDEDLTDEVGTNLPPSRLGAQLYSVANQVGSLGWAKLLAAMAEIGYRTVEFAGFSGSTPAELRTILADTGLTAVGQHAGMDDASIEAAGVLGLPYTGITLITNIYGPRTDDWKRTAADFDAFGARCAAAGTKFYVHMHPEPYVPLADDPQRLALDVLLENTDPELVAFEMDIYWAYYAAASLGASGVLFDPVDYVVAHPGRFPIFHVKDGRALLDRSVGGERATLMNAPTAGPPSMDGITDVGQGDIPFKTFFGKLAEVSDLASHHFVWERDTASNHPRGSLASARASYLMMRYDHMAGPSRY